MKKITKSITSLLFVGSLFMVSCEKQISIENESIQPIENHYKISIDSLKTQALGLQNLFSTNTTKTKQLTIENVLTLNEVLSQNSITKTESTDDDASDIYIINFENNEGFAILTDHALVSNNIIAYSDSGNISSDEDNPGLINYLKQAPEYISSLSYTSSVPTFTPLFYEPNTSVEPSNWGVTSQGSVIWQYYKNGQSIVNTETTKSPIITVNWGQEAPYNTQISNFYPAGCVAMAMAQIMSAHEYPTSITYFKNNLSYDLSWTAAKYGTFINSNVGYLISDIGDAVNMVYADAGSSAYDSTVTNAFKKYNYNASELTIYDQSIVIDEINNNQPVYVRGSDYSVLKGHAWVVDGYKNITGTSTYATDYVNDDSYYTPLDVYQVGQRVSYIQTITNYLHINWGWDGKNNGYFRAFDTADAYEYDGSVNTYTYNFNEENYMIYDIYPEINN